MSSSPSPRLAGPYGWLVERAAGREAAGLRRRLAPRTRPDDGLVDLASNDYLDLARHPVVVEAAVEAVRTWGAGATGSRLVTGSTSLHAELEAELAAFVGCAAGLVFSSGYLANLGALTALAGPGDLVVSDAFNHASIVDACRLSRARVVVVPHADPAAVRATLAARSEERALVVTESVFSVDGDAAPLADLYEVSSDQGAVLLVDEAHGVGTAGPGGRGAVCAAGLAGRPGVVVAATLSKALGSQGGAVLGGQEVVDHVVDAARAFLFDTALAPASAGAALAAVRLLAAEPDRALTVGRRARFLAGLLRAQGLEVGVPAGAILSVRVGSPASAVAAAQHCLDAGLRVGCFRPPSVPDGLSRLRLVARSGLSEEAAAAAGAVVLSALASGRQR